MTETRTYTMAVCPRCKLEYAYTDWTDAHWWFPHICLGNESIFTIPKSVLRP